MSNLNIADLLKTVAAELQHQLQRSGIDNPLMIGIHTGGAWVAKELHRELGLQEPLGTLNISFYRDDFSRIGVHPQVKPSRLPVTVEDRHIILVDDVLQTGRTIRAALNEIFDYGRPASVTLAVLVERSGRELPIEPAVAGTHLELDARHQIKLEGPEPLHLTVLETELPLEQG
ncbi:MAG TPA: bifunctional pyr operon transcriptional regulator/uracil phosphoribosyltransferase PyrR [Gammaproteobacteria bacterium]|nr:bifunctional pyr operon transcriptional regulator/uracil phosphoribosyltransferase PyrR [Gammaproteobacteria bacterium]